MPHARRTSHLGIIQRSRKYSSSLTEHILTLTSLISIKLQWAQWVKSFVFYLCVNELTTESALRLLNETFLKHFSKYSKLNLAVTEPDMDPFIRDLLWVEKPNSIHSVFITPIFMCKQGSLTHHCDSCLHHRLFWAEVTQDTVWIHPNLAAHSMPELNHLCLLCK